MLPVNNTLSMSAPTFIALATPSLPFQTTVNNAKKKTIVPTNKL